MEKIYDIKTTIAKNIIKYRKANNLTQQQLAEKLNYSDKAISKWERGEGIPDIDVLNQMAQIFNIPIEELLHQETTIEKVQTFTKNRYVIVLLSILLTWLVAMICCVIVEMIKPNTYPSYLAFIIAIPVSFILCIIFNNIWGSRIYNMIFVSGLNWGACVSLVVGLTPIFDKIWYLYFISAAFEIIVLVWYLLDTKKAPSNKNKKNN